MWKSLTLFMIALGVALTAPASARVTAQGQSIGFFVSSTGSGMGGNLGDWPGRTSIARRSPQGRRGESNVACLSQHVDALDANARDRIGSGPWFNAKGTQIASNVALGEDKANINNDTALDEQGRPINAEGAPNRHDILTGSTADGQATPTTCQNWTSSASDQSAMLGHHDRLTFGKPGSPWNSAHPSKGCSQENLVATGGAGLIYCFAAK